MLPTTRFSLCYYIREKSAASSKNFLYLPIILVGSTSSRSTEQATAVSIFATLPFLEIARKRDRGDEKQEAHAIFPFLYADGSSVRGPVETGTFA